MVHLVRQTRYAKGTYCKPCYENVAGKKNAEAAFNRGLSGLVQLSTGTCDICKAVFK